MNQLPSQNKSGATCWSPQEGTLPSLEQETPASYQAEWCVAAPGCPVGASGCQDALTPIPESWSLTADLVGDLLGLTIAVLCLGPRPYQDGQVLQHVELGNLTVLSASPQELGFQELTCRSDKWPDWTLGLHSDKDGLTLRYCTPKHPAHRHYYAAICLTWRVWVSPVQADPDCPYQCKPGSGPPPAPPGMIRLTLD